MDKFTAHMLVDGVTVDLASDTLEGLVAMCGRLTHPQAYIRPDDQPDAGVEVAVRGLRNVIAEDTQPQAAAIFGGAAVPLPPASAPSSVDAAAVPTAPAAQTAISATVPVPPAPAATIADAVFAQQAGAVPTPPANGVELDIEGLPWDHRIHASTKTKTKPGAWTAKRNVPESVVAEVKAQLRQVMAIPPVSAAPLSVTPGVPLPPQGTTAAVAGPGSTTATPAGSPTNGAAPIEQTANAEPTAGTIHHWPEKERFAKLMTYLTPHMTPPSGRLSPDAALQILATQGFPGWPSLIARPDMVQAVWKAFDQALGVQ